MGLDISAFSQLKPFGVCNPEGHFDTHPNHIHAFTYPDFPQSFRGIPVLDTFTGWGGKQLFLNGGCYMETAATERHKFQAGSYAGYSDWRDDLRLQFNPDTDPEMPFYELIWFADNEGSIGPEAAKDLLADFRQHADRYAPRFAYREYSAGKYADWTRACELAADSGLIRFH